MHPSFAKVLEHYAKGHANFGWLPEVTVFFKEWGSSNFAQKLLRIDAHFGHGILVLLYEN